MIVNLNYSIANEGQLDGSSVKIPLDYKNFVKLYNGYNSLEPWVDGNTSEGPAEDWGVFVNPAMITYEFKGLKDVVLDRIRMWDSNGLPNNPTMVYAVDEYYQRVLIGTFTGTISQDWDDKTFSPVKAKYLHIIGEGSDIGSIGYNFHEIEVYGSYEEDANPVTPEDKPVLFDNLLGTCTYEWDVLKPNDALTVDDDKLDTIKRLSLIRHYFDWNRVEDEPGEYRYHPERHGGWGLDTMYQALKDEGIFVLTCLQNIPEWMADTFPEPSHTRIQVRYPARFDNIWSYTDIVKFSTIFCARYGSDTVFNVKGTITDENQLPSSNQELNDTYLLESDYTIDGNPATCNEKAFTWTGSDWEEIITIDSTQPSIYEPRNSIRIGTGLVDMYEVGNETNRFWQGRDSYLTAREHAAQMSACYDGHKGAMGPYMGIKNVCPSMKVSTQGSVAVATEYFRGMIDWSKQYRGFKEDGTVDVPFDVINFHTYRTDAGGEQWGDATRGMSPEASGYYEEVLELRKLIQENCPQVELFLGETGYDWNQGSPHKAIAIGGKSVLEVAGDWTLRMVLESARVGVGYISFFQLYDDDPSGESATQYATMGLSNNDGTNRNSLAYLTQCRTFLSGFVYDGEVSETPRVLRFKKDSEYVYAVWSPTENSTTGNHSLSFPETPDTITKYEMNGTNSTPSSSGVTVANPISVSYSETPVFIKTS